MFFHSLNNKQPFPPPNPVRLSLYTMNKRTHSYSEMGFMLAGINSLLPAILFYISFQIPDFVCLEVISINLVP